MESFQVLAMVQEKVLTYLFPQWCRVCNGEGSFLCATCKGNLHHEIKKSDEEKMSFFYCTHYSARAAQELVRLCKYHFLKPAGVMMGEMMGLAWQFEKERLPTIDAVIPLPLHSKRFAERGFNQAEIIAKKFGEIVGIPVRPNILVRVKMTQPQVDLKGDERMKNVANAFEVTRMFHGSILLIDDVITTGATMREAMSALHCVGAQKVYGLAFAKG